ncbi:MAG: hypothetical protein ABJH06_06160 [Paraglaciecola sp.]|uniref:hypothetical protein n=1 Tax=Paraglaciecola sp. TaxID=1920173 RepID=UPI00329A7455
MCLRLVSVVAFLIVVTSCAVQPVKQITKSKAQTEINSTDDTEIKTKIVGVWFVDEELHHRDWPSSTIKAYGEDFYYSNGVVEGYTTFSYPNETQEWAYRANWWVDDGYLYMRVVWDNSNTPIDGHTSKDKIISISDNKLVLLAEDGTKLTRYRK